MTTTGGIVQDEFEKTLREFVATGTGLDQDNVFEASEKRPRPRKPYATLLLIDDGRRGFPITHQGDESQGTTSLQYRRAIFSLQFYRAGAIDLARAFCTYVESDLGLEYAELNEFRIRQPVSFRPLNIPVGDGLEKRAQIDLGVDYAHKTRQHTGWIDDLEVDLRVDVPGPNISIDEEIRHGP